MRSVGLALVVGEEQESDGAKTLMREHTFPWALVAEPTNLVPCLGHYGVEGNMSSNSIKLKILPKESYKGVNQYDPIKYYYWPVFGRMYCRRVEMALEACTGGDRVLEIGFGTGLAFPNFNDMYKEIHGLDLTADIDTIYSVFEPFNIPLLLKKGNVLDMPYEDNYFDTVLLISILEHLKPDELTQAFREIKRVLKPGGQVVYGVPIERPFMVFMFRVLGHDIRDHHFSTEKDISHTAELFFRKISVQAMKATPSFMGDVYEVGQFVKS